LRFSTRQRDLLGVFGTLGSFLIGSWTLFFAPLLCIPFYMTTFFSLYYLDIIHENEGEMESIKEKMESKKYPEYDEIGFVNTEVYWAKHRIDEIEKSGVLEELEEKKKRYAHYKKIQDEYYDRENGGQTE